MENDASVVLQKAYELIKSGQRLEALSVLAPFVRANPNNSDAWYLLAFALTEPERRLYAFKQVLRIDPSNESVKKQIDRLSTALAAQSAPSVQVQPAPPQQTTAPTPTEPPSPQQPVTPKRSGVLNALLVAGAIVLFAGTLGIAVWLIRQNRPPAVQVPTTAPALQPSATVAVQATESILEMTPEQNAPVSEKPTPTKVAALNLNMFTNPETNWEAAAFTERKSGHLKAGESATVPLDIDSASEVFFNMGWSGKEPPAFTLTNPDGQLIDDTYINDHPEDVSFGTATFLGMSTYDVRNPPPGPWEFNITASEAGDYVVFSVLDRDGLVLSVASDAYTYYPGDVVTIGARLEDKGIGLAGATVTAQIGLADKTVKTVTLTDLGEGRYAALYQVPEAIGFAMIDVLAKGSQNGVKFTRHMSNQFMIAPDDLKLTGEHADKLETDARGEKSIAVQFDVSAGQAGEYSFAAQLLFDQQIIATMSTNITVVPGKNTVTIRFPGEDIRHYRLDGPYTIVILPIADINTGIYIDVKENNTWQTEAYQWRNFGDVICFSFSANVKPDPSAGKIEISPAPNCPNGQYLSATKVTLKVTPKSGYQFKGWTGDAGGVDVSSPFITLQVQRDMEVNAIFEPKP